MGEVSERVEADERARAYLDAALDCVVMADALGRVVEFNPAAERTFGYSREEAVGRTLAELIVPPSLRERHARAFARFAETGEERILGRRLELTGMRADGSELPVELALSRVDAEPLLVCGALRDLSEAKRAQEDLRRLAETQAALRRVATLVARQAPADELLATVAEEAARILDAPLTSILAYEADGSSTLCGAFGDVNPFAVGDRYAPHPGVVAEVWRTGRPASVDYAEAGGKVADRLVAAGIRSGLGVPVVVDERTWGVAIAMATEQKPLPGDTEARLIAFTELVATAIANTQAREDLRSLVEEQSALRRLATEVARGTDPAAVFDAVCEETGRLFGATSTNLAHFTPDGSNLTMAGWSLRDTHVPTGTRLPLEGETINVVVRRTAAPARFDSYDGAPGELAALIRERGIRSEVAAPVVVEGRVWGVLVAGWDTDEPSPEGTEHRLADFAELVGTAVANATARSELVASRARIVASADQARRKIERDLHDGTQQQLVALGLDLQTLETKLPDMLPEAHEDLARVRRALDAVLDDVREISRGVHPAILSSRGLEAALRALARRSTVPVELEVDVVGRLPQSIEIAAYYAVSEALANVAKHARASFAAVTAGVSGGRLAATVRDDGVGGADAATGSGLTGLVDRIEALGGRVLLESPPGRGTTVSIELPLGDA